MSKLGERYIKLDTEWDEVRVKVHAQTATPEEIVRERQIYRELCSLASELEDLQATESKQEEIEAKLKIIGASISPSGFIQVVSVHVLDWKIGADEGVLDGYWKVEELEAAIWLIKNVIA